jgi:peptidoglycan lytic transglycosylase G
MSTTQTSAPGTNPEPSDEERRHRRRVFTVVALIVLVPLLVFGSIAGWFLWQLDPPGKSGDAVEVRVEDGWSVSRIGDELVDRGVINSSFVFSVYSRLKSNSDFQAGTYQLKRDMGVRGAVSALEDGPHLDYTELAVPPGLQISEVAPRVGQVPGRSADAFLAAVRSGAKRSKYQPPGNTSLEGLLWPDTYRVADTDDEIDVLGSMVSQFEQHADALGLENASVQGQTPYQILTIASLIEAEAKVDEDRPLIASVIYNRLRENMKLQIDATVLYASGDPTKVTITADDLQMNSPYNTYVVGGLPPTPIGAVSEASLQAALHPADTDYFYYVIGDKDGRHKFARTGAEHEQNVEAARAAGLL